MEVAATLQSVCIGSATALGERPDQQVSSGHHMRESVLGGLPCGCRPSGVVSLALAALVSFGPRAGSHGKYNRHK